MFLMDKVMLDKVIGHKSLELITKLPLSLPCNLRQKQVSIEIFCMGDKLQHWNAIHH